MIQWIALLCISILGLFVLIKKGLMPERMRRSDRG